jgi:hypothetical protein
MCPASGNRVVWALPPDIPVSGGLSTAHCSEFPVFSQTRAIGALKGHESRKILNEFPAARNRNLKIITGNFSRGTANHSPKYQGGESPDSGRSWIRLRVSCQAQRFSNHNWRL